MRWDRLRTMTPHELRWRTRAALRMRLQRMASRLRTPRWNRGAIGRIVTEDVHRIVHRDVAAGRWNEVHDALADRINRRQARFVLDSSARDRVCRAVVAIRADAAADSRARADRILSGQYDLLGYRRLRFTTAAHRVDWHFDPVWSRSAPRVFYSRVPYLDPSIGDHKIIWELNRHQHWLALGRAAWLTGDERYAQAVLDELYDWLDANPPLIGINWASMLEIGFRSLSWVWTLHWLLGLDGQGERDAAHPALAKTGAGRPWLVDMLVALTRQLTHVEQNLSYYFSPNTHLTGEALALYVAGVALPELAAAERWIDTGRRVLLDEIDRQILADGGHAERSTHYQRYTLEFYLLATLTARLAGDADAAARFETAAARLAEFTRVLADDNGRLPLIGDDDGGMLWPIAGRACTDVRDALATAAAVLDRPMLAPWGPAEEAIWVAGADAGERVRARAPAAPSAASPAPAAPASASRALASSGYVVMRDGRGSHAVFDAGAHGYLNAGHAHADALALTLTLGGRPLLVDPGTSTYTMDRTLRDRLRSSMSHNTVTIDGRSQSEPAGPFHWHTRADATLATWRAHGTVDYAEGSHDGYAPLRHRRAIVRTTHGGWLVADDIPARRRHAAVAHWHFAPEWMLRAEAGRVHAGHPSGDGAWLVYDGGDATIIRGDRHSGLGWYAPAYGVLEPASTVRVATDAETTPRMLTWIDHDSAWTAPALRRCHVEGAGDDAVVAVEIVSGGRCSFFLLRMNASAAAAHGCRAAGFETDARLLHALADGERLLSLDVVDARLAATAHQGWPSIEAEAPLPHLHIETTGGIVDLRSAAPSAALRIRGLAASQRLRLNGRELSAAAPGGVRLVLPSDWCQPEASQLLPQAI